MRKACRDVQSVCGKGQLGKLRRENKSRGKEAVLEMHFAQIAAIGVKPGDGFLKAFAEIVAGLKPE